MVMTKKQGRNDACDCGSGKKFKKCCGASVAKDLTVRDMIKCLYLLLEGASEGNLAIPKGPIPFSKKSLDKVPDNLVNEIMIADNPNFIILTTKPKEQKKSLIHVPGRELYI